MIARLEQSYTNHAALCDVLLLALERAVRAGHLAASEVETKIMLASQRDCGYIRATIENLLQPGG